MLQALDQQFSQIGLAKNSDLAGRRLRGLGLRLGLHGAFAVVVEAASALAAIESGIDQFLLDQRRQEALVAVESTPH